MSQPIKLGFLRCAIVDADDHEWLSKIDWYVSISRGLPYARRQHQRTRPVGETWMHRLIMDCPVGKIVHHKNGNTLDNRKINLEILEQKNHPIGKTSRA